MAEAMQAKPVDEPPERPEDRGKCNVIRLLMSADRNNSRVEGAWSALW